MPGAGVLEALQEEQEGKALGMSAKKRVDGGQPKT